ncbi:HTTM domain-containing protein [Pirellulaceae bacterium]|nr:HTTM domain-containing protein [Pirellulaceae bacterium]
MTNPEIQTEVDLKKSAPSIGSIGKWQNRLNQSVDVLPLVYFRLVFGFMMLVEVYRYFTHGWIQRYYISPEFLFKYYGFEWVQPLPGIGMYLHFLCMGVLAVLIMLGLWYRWVMPLFFVSFTYVFLLDESNYLNHFYLICLVSFVLIFLPLNRFASLDVGRRPELQLDRVPVWTLWLLRFQIAIPYVYGGIAKVNGDWLRGEPMREWLGRRTDFAFIGPYFQEEWLVYAFSYGGLLFDLLIVPMLLWRRTRWLAFAWVFAFHMLNNQLFSIGIFPWFMLLATPLFFPDDTLRKVLNKFNLGLAAVRSTSSAPSHCFYLGRAGLVGLYLFIAFNVLIPFRHFLYPGNVSWTEEGHRFAWHMKLRDKDGITEFQLVDRGTGEEWCVDPDDYLSSRQQRKMPTRPGMILQFGHYLGQKWRDKGYDNIEVYANAEACLNSRPYQTLIDPNVDLMKVSRFLKPATWVLPLDDETGRLTSHMLRAEHLTVHETDQ